LTSRRFSYGIPDAWYAGVLGGKPDHEKARAQHDRCAGALERCGLEVTVLDADELSCLSLRLVGGEL
jgi:N-dimethylarginine dimethylaminohydrolase